jgi:hypothetical protein
LDCLEIKPNHGVQIVYRNQSVFFFLPGTYRSLTEYRVHFDNQNLRRGKKQESARDKLSAMRGQTCIEFLLSSSSNQLRNELNRREL